MEARSDVWHSAREHTRADAGMAAERGTMARVNI